MHRSFMHRLLPKESNEINVAAVIRAQRRWNYRKNRFAVLTIRRDCSHWCLPVDQFDSSRFNHLIVPNDRMAECRRCRLRLDGCKISFFEVKRSLHLVETERFRAIRLIVASVVSSSHHQRYLLEIEWKRKYRVSRISQPIQR